MRLMKKEENSIIIGIDPGVKTGVACFDLKTRRLIEVRTFSILEALDFVRSLSKEVKVVYVEDARKVKYGTAIVRAQGAGSIKRDCKIWEEFLTREQVPAVYLRPNKELTKYDAKLFQKVTGWDKRTSEHARDAAMLVFNRYK